jgi:putative membrane protein
MCGLFGFGHMGFFGGILMFVFWAFVIGLILWGATRMGRHAHYMRNAPYGGNALEIARERYAKGEISKEEFEQLKKDLS